MAFQKCWWGEACFMPPLLCRARECAGSPQCRVTMHKNALQVAPLRIKPKDVGGFTIMTLCLCTLGNY